MNNISAVIITKNEENNIGQCIDALLWADEIVVVDAFSSDRTVEICKKYTKKIFTNDFIDFSSQKNYALSKSANDWILFVDADEKITPELREEISALRADDCEGYYIPRKNMIFGRYMKYGGHQRDLQLRLFRKSRSHFEGPVHERAVVDGRVKPLHGYIEHYSTKSLSDYCKKLNYYTGMEAKMMAEEGMKFSAFQALAKPAGKFIYQYIIQQGFRDGREGFIYYSLSAFYIFLKQIKLWSICDAGRI